MRETSSSITGLTVEYYMKDGDILTDNSLKFATPIKEGTEEFKEFEKFLEECKRVIKTAFKSDEYGSIVLGTLYVRSSDIKAIKLTVNKENCV